MSNNISPQLKSRREWLDKMRKRGEQKGWLKPKYEPKSKEEVERQKRLDKVPF